MKGGAGGYRGGGGRYISGSDGYERKRWRLVVSIRFDGKDGDGGERRQTYTTCHMKGGDRGYGGGGRRYGGGGDGYEKKKVEEISNMGGQGVVKVYTVVVV
ncbi:predicted protein [Arabidopsis lyrata subsp. lyrata]|uniref:Predicted protein n=1 Tax=Arabidopsis lyrata subsp. lyrata TaxID=81972 RepID=D7LYK6_ARALL|nr:predicted protein [Arabidopsis lyrata subsp. lyrata]